METNESTMPTVVETPQVHEAPAAAPPPTSTLPSSRWWRKVGVLSVVIALAAVSFSLGRMTTGEEAAPAATAQQNTTQGGTLITLPAGEEPVAAVAAALTPSMVQIHTDLGLGSGVVYDAEGLILTAAHVVGSSGRVLVQLADGSKVDGTVVGADSTSDVAVIRVEAAGLVAAPMAIDEELQPGQMAIAIGSPFGLDQTVTAGVISSVSRAVVGSDGSVRELIQTDAPINPGNSGGALADRQGRVIGINDQIFSTSGGNEGVGFAIPITYATQIADRLVAGESIETAVLGVTGTDPSLGQAGGLITGVQPGSPASAAGLEDGDLVIAVDASPIQSFTELAAAIRTHQPGDVISLTVSRSGTTLELEVTLGVR